MDPGNNMNIVADDEILFDVTECDTQLLSQPVQFGYYTVILIPKGRGVYHADFGAFPFTGPVLLFSTPLQQIYIEEADQLSITMVRFHGDFYCIEYHRSEVACNGLLFNNCYLEPAVNLTPKDCRIFRTTLNELKQEFNEPEPNDIVLRSYLQLLLARSSAIKIKAHKNSGVKELDLLMEEFRMLIDEHFLTLHKPSDYAGKLKISPNSLTKRSAKYFKKTPSSLITERLIIEAKKHLHLTRQSIKEIAYLLNFQDEYYFSRVFKKFTGVSPQAFRDKTGISIVANPPGQDE